MVWEKGMTEEAMAYGATSYKNGEKFGRAREREEIAAYLDSMGLETTAREMLRVRGDQKPCECPCHDRKWDGTDISAHCSCHKKPGKIARLEANRISPSQQDLIEMVFKINELIDAVEGIKAWIAGQST